MLPFRPILALALLLLATPAVTHAQLTWDGGGDGSSWGDPLNWSSDTVPTGGDDVVLDGGVTVTLDIPAQTADLTLDDATLQGASDLTVTGLLDWRLGEHAGTGTWTVTGSALLAQNTSKTVRGPVVLACDATWETSHLDFGPAGSLVHEAGFDLDIVDGPAASKLAGHHAAPITGPDPTADNTDLYVFHLRGTTYANSSVEFGVSVSQEGSLESTVDLDFDSGSRFTGTSILGDQIRISYGYGTHELAGDFQAAPQAQPTGLVLDGNQTLATLDTGYSTSPGLAFSASGPIGIKTDVPHLDLNGGTVQLFDGTTVEVMEVRSFPNLILIENVARVLDTLDLDTLAPVTIDGALTVEGTATVHDAGISLTDASELRISLGGYLDWETTTTAQTISPAAGDATVRVEGTFRVRSGSSTPRVFADLVFDAGGNLILEPGTSLQMENDATLSGNVTLDGWFHVADGILDLQDPLSVSGTSGIEVHSGGILDASGVSSLGGTLDLTGTLQSTTPTTLQDVYLSGGTLMGPGPTTVAGTTIFEPDNAVDDHDIQGTVLTLQGPVTWREGDILLQDANLVVGPGSTFTIDHTSTGLTLSGSGTSLIEVQGTMEGLDGPDPAPSLAGDLLFGIGSGLVLEGIDGSPSLILRGNGSLLGGLTLGFGSQLLIDTGDILLDLSQPATGEGTLKVGTNATLTTPQDVTVQTIVQGEVEATGDLTFTRPLRSEGGRFSGGFGITAARGIVIDPQGLDVTEVAGGTTLTLEDISQWHRGDLLISGGSRLVTAGFSQFHVLPTGGNLTVRQDAGTPQLEVLEIHGNLVFAPGVGTAPAVEANLVTGADSRVEVQAGVTLTLRAGGTADGEIHVGDTAKTRILFQDLAVAPAGILSGFGTFEPSLGGRINLDGLLAPGAPDSTGTLTFNGPVDFGSGSRVEIQLASPSLGDAVVLGGSQSIDGVLDVKINDTSSYTGTVTRTVLTTGSLAGTFGSTQISPPGYTLVPNYGPQIVTVDLTASPGSIGGVVFDDAGADGLRDPGDPAIAGWTVELLEAGIVTDSRITDAQGAYSFAGLDAPNLYRVRVVPPGGWVSTTLSQTQLDGVDVEVQAGEATTVDFGYTESSGRVRGTVVHDIDEDAALDVFDPALRGHTVRATRLDGPGVFTVQTDEDGNYSFSLVPGSYLIEPVPFPGWTPAFPTPLPTVEVTLGGSVDNVYLGVDSPRRSVRGIVYIDENANGEFDRLDDTVIAPDQVRIEGAGATLTFENLGVGDQYGASIGSGPVTVIHPDAPGLRVLTPPGGRLEIRSEEESGKDIVQDFGLVAGSVLSATVYIDRDNDGFLDPDVDEILDGGKVDVSGLGSFTLDNSGSLSVAVEPGTYTFHIVDSLVDLVSNPEVMVGENEHKHVELRAKYDIPDYLLTGLLPSGPGSLEDAIDQINAGNASGIEIGVSGEIVLTSPLPPLTDAARIVDGNAPKMEFPGLTVRGDNCVDCDGLVLQSDDNFLSGIRFEGFSGHGIVVQGDDNLITGMASVGNGGAGIRVEGQDTRIRNNFLSGNAQGPIQHAGIAPPAPVLQYEGVGGTVVTGTLQADPFTWYEVEVFGNVACAGAGPAETLQGQVGVETDATGFASFSVPVAGQADFWTATVTEFGGSTSEVSVCLDTNATAVEPNPLPASVVHFAYPNPARRDSRISFALPSASRVRVRVYDLRGRLVSTLHEGAMPAGRHGVTWGGTDARGARVAAGIYLYELVVGSERYTRKIARIR